MGKKGIEVRKDIKKAEEVVPASARKKAYEALIKTYKAQNPVKYEAKKEVLKERLKNIK